MSQPPNQPYSGPPHPEQPTSDTPWPGQLPAQPYPGSAPDPQAYPDQPFLGRPNPDVPASVPAQPGYPPQPTYGQQPSYPPPGYPQPGYPQAPTKKSKALPITLVSIALVLVLCVGGGTAVYLIGRNTAEGIADAIASAAPTQPTRPTEEATATITLVEPRTLGGRPKVTDPTFADRVDELKNGLALMPGASQVVGSIYGTPAEQDLVVFVAAEAKVADPKQELDSAFTGSNVDTLKLTGISSIPAGPLGGVAKCAKGIGGGTPLAMCAWADEGSSGWVIWYFTSLSEAKDEFVKVRSQIEKKSN